jgi:hypothetical protein
MFSMTSAGEGWVCRWRRFVLLTTFTIVVLSALAAQNPSLSVHECMLTDAKGVCIVCYITAISAPFKLLLWPEFWAAGDVANKSLLVDVEGQNEHQAVPVMHKEMYSEKTVTAGDRLVTVLLPRAVLVIQPQLYSIGAPMTRQLLSTIGAI